MPVFVVDGRRYKVPFKSLFNSNKNVCEHIMADKRANALEPEVTLEQATATRAPRTKDSDHALENVQKTADECDQAWSAREDRLLRDLVAFRVPWGRIAIVLGNRPVEEVQKRWNYIRSGKPQNVEVAVDGTVSTNHRRSTEYTRTQPESKTERHVSFADPLVTAVDTDNDEDLSQPPVKRVFYIDEEFSLEDVIMLHNIAAKWERDRWLAISTRFNDTTGRKITPEQAKSVVDN